jgi:hypothetical protein
MKHLPTVFLFLVSSFFPSPVFGQDWLKAEQTDVSAPALDLDSADPVVGDVSGVSKPKAVAGAPTTGSKPEVKKMVSPKKVVVAPTVPAKAAVITAAATAGSLKAPVGKVPEASAVEDLDSLLDDGPEKKEVISAVQSEKSLEVVEVKASAPAPASVPVAAAIPAPAPVSVPDPVPAVEPAGELVAEDLVLEPEEPKVPVSNPVAVAPVAAAPVVPAEEGLELGEDLLTNSDASLIPEEKPAVMANPAVLVPEPAPPSVPVSKDLGGSPPKKIDALLSGLDEGSSPVVGFESKDLVGDLVVETPGSGSENGALNDPVDSASPAQAGAPEKEEGLLGRLKRIGDRSAARAPVQHAPIVPIPEAAMPTPLSRVPEGPVEVYELVEVEEAPPISWKAPAYRDNSRGGTHLNFYRSTRPVYNGGVYTP